MTPLIRSDVPHREEVECRLTTTRASSSPASLNAVSEALTTEELTKMLKRVDVDKEPIETVAQDFIEAHGLA